MELPVYGGLGGSQSRAPGMCVALASWERPRNARVMSDRDDKGRKRMPCSHGLLWALPFILAMSLAQPVIDALCDTARVCAVPPELYLIFWFAVVIGIGHSLYCYSRRLLCRREKD